MTRIGLCLLGCGAIAQRHSRTVRAVDSQVDLHFASRSLGKAEHYRRRFGGRRAFGGYEEACASPAVDAVVICTPPAYHREHASLAAAHGKAILVEKPVTRTLDELTGLEDAVARAGVTSMVAENYHFKPVARALRRHLEAGDIGDLLFIEVNKTGRHRPGGWRADPGLMGGGALLEGGVHWVHLVLRLGGRPRDVAAAVPGVAPGPNGPRAGFEENIEVVIKFEGGAVGKLLHSWNTANRLRGLQASKLYGTQGNITFESNGLWLLVAGRRTRFHLPGLRDIAGFRGMFRAFLTSLREGRPPEMSLALARQDLEVVEAAYRSLASGRFEPVGEGVSPSPGPG